MPARGGTAARSYVVAEQRVEQAPVARVIDLAREVLEEAVELLEITVGAREEARRGLRPLGSPSARASDVPDLDHELVTKPLDAAADADELAALEPPGEHVGVAERAGR